MKIEKLIKFVIIILLIVFIFYLGHKSGKYSGRFEVVYVEGWSEYETDRLELIDHKVPDSIKVWCYDSYKDIWVRLKNCPY